MTDRRILIAGATGVIGTAAVQHFAGGPGWTTFGLSRGKPDYEAPDAEFVSADLTDPESVTDALAHLPDLTHIVFAALQVRADANEAVLVNRSMLGNLIEAANASSPALRRVILLEGAKAYGVHLGPFKVPALESDPRHMPPNFYYAQEDLLRERSSGASWDFTVLRPDVVCGTALGVPYNLALVLAVYAVLSKEFGLPLKFPGRPKTWTQFAQVTDATLLARALEWAATTPECCGETFNITNGDIFQWQHLWPQIASCFDMATGTPQPMRLADVMADKGPVWQAIQQRFGLRSIDYDRLVSWEFGDWVFDCEFPVVSDTVKARQFGFHDCMHTPDMFRRIFTELTNTNVIP